MDLKKNGGILFIKSHVAIKVLFVFFILMFYRDAYGQYRIIAKNKKDSCFCIKKYPYYDFENQSPILGVTVPEQEIRGKEKSLVDICLATQKLVYKQYKDSVKNMMISLDVLVDENGEIRGAIIPDNGRMAYEISAYALSLLREEGYRPAIHRKPITYTFHFMMEIP